MASAAVGAANIALRYAVFHNHQRQPPINNSLAGQILFQLPNLLVPQLKGYRGALQPQLAPQQQCAAVENVQPEISPQGKIQSVHNGQVSQISNGGRLHLRVPFQSLPQLLLVRRPKDSRQYGAQLCQLTVALRVHLIQKLHRQIQNLRPPGQFLGKLLGPADGNCQPRLRWRLRVRFRQRGSGGNPPCRNFGQYATEFVYSRPAHAVDGPGAQHQSILHLCRNRPDPESGAARLHQSVFYLRLRHRPVLCRLRNRAGQRHGCPCLWPGKERGGQLRRLSCPGGKCHGNRYRPVFKSVFIGLPYLGEPCLRPFCIFRTNAKHLPAFLPQPVPIGKA